MALQGMNIDVHDIDIQSDQFGVYEIENLLSEYVTQPVRYLASERMRSHLGNLEIDRVKIDIMGDVLKLLENQVWEESVRVERYKHWVDFDNIRVPVLSLDYEYEAYLKMGRIEKAEKIRNWLDNKGT